MMLMLQIRDIAVALKIGLHFGRVDKAPASAPGNPPASVQEGPLPSPRKTPVGFAPNPPEATD
ncbi:hypothetical protein SEA_CASSIA_67 [Arthrobacter phage Cassia]|uniref:Uncharacterized protein n=1 Tax=Arthrobacter phage Cassia TaxID=2927275 RepID=A0AAF0GHD1_9CAUD|nr:hypothetical protein SEA_CASSIA_67 [Arthrobacter phage Cassia]